jgi:hypothetical protein
MDGLTIVALILQHLCPHMYAVIGKAKKLTVAQFDNDIHLFFDAIKSIKLQINPIKKTLQLKQMTLLSETSSFNSKMNIFLKISNTSLLLLNVAGKWTRRLLLHSLSWMMRAHTASILWNWVPGNWK